MNKVVLYIFLVLLSGCENLKKNLGLAKDTPDEFLINKTDPIERPPNYELLPPVSKYSDYNGYKDYNRVKLINNIRNKYSLTIYGKKQFEIILNRLKNFQNHWNKISLWYDFKNNIFKNI